MESKIEEAKQRVGNNFWMIVFWPFTIAGSFLLAVPMIIFWLWLEIGARVWLWFDNFVMKLQGDNL